MKKTLPNRYESPRTKPSSDADAVGIVENEYSTATVTTAPVRTSTPRMAVTTYRRLSAVIV